MGYISAARTAVTAARAATDGAATWAATSAGDRTATADGHSGRTSTLATVKSVLSFKAGVIAVYLIIAVYPDIPVYLGIAVCLGVAVYMGITVCSGVAVYMGIAVCSGVAVYMGVAVCSGIKTVAHT